MQNILKNADTDDVVRAFHIVYTQAQVIIFGDPFQSIHTTT